MRRRILDATRAISIAAPAAEVWPLLLRHAPNMVRRETGLADHMRTKDVESGRWMIWWDSVGDHSSTWALYPAARGARLVVRERARYPWTSARLFGVLLADAADIVRLPRYLLDIKREAEAGARRSGIVVFRCWPQFADDLGPAVIGHWRKDADPPPGGSAMGKETQRWRRRGRQAPECVSRLSPFKFRPAPTFRPSGQDLILRIAAVPP